MNCKLSISAILSVACLNTGFVSAVFADDEAMENERIRPVVTLDDIRVAGREKPAMAAAVDQPSADTTKAEKPSTDTAGLGKKAYQTACAACHDTGAAGAPVVGDKAGWSARMGQGVEALTASATNGKGAMPPKGGQMHLTDDDMKAIVEYMVKESS